MRSRIVLISMSRLGAHTSRMGDISRIALRLNVNPPESGTSGKKRWRDLALLARALSATRDAWARLEAEVRLRRAGLVAGGLYVYLTHQTGTYGSTMRNMRSMASPSRPYNGTYSRATRVSYLPISICLLALQIPMNRIGPVTGTPPP